MERFGWDAFEKNDWTEWAESHGLILEHQSIKTARKIYRSKVSLGGKKVLVSDCFVHSCWTDWSQGRLMFSSTILTIGEHKKLFQGKRPDWAKTFGERRIGKKHISIVEHRMQFPVPEDNRLLIHYFIERELFIPNFPNREVAVERLLDASGNCTKVTTIHLGPSRVRQEDKISKNDWKVTFLSENMGELEKCSYEQLLIKPDIWFRYLQT
ncbi:MAG: hypothetical protein AAB954_01275 [Patescibacteria group bacterium]